MYSVVDGTFNVYFLKSKFWKAGIVQI